MSDSEMRVPEDVLISAIESLKIDLQNARDERDRARQQRDEAVARAESLANRPCVEICLEARAEGDGGCGACAMCCGEQFERAMKAELLLGKAMKERDFLQQEADRLRSGTWIESDCFYFDDRDDMMGEIAHLRAGIAAYRTICVCPKEVAAGKQHVWLRDGFGKDVPCESCDWEREDAKRRKHCRE